MDSYLSKMKIPDIQDMCKTISHAVNINCVLFKMNLRYKINIYERDVK